MRVIRTEMYFDPSQIRDLQTSTPGSANPGVAFAWFKAARDFDPAGVDKIEGLSNVRRLQKDEVGFVLDFLLRQETLSISLGAPFPSNGSIIEYLFQQDVVLEHSPPFAVSLKGLIDNTNLPIVVGTFLGWEVAQTNVAMLSLRSQLA